MVNISKPKLTLLQREIIELLFIKAGTSMNQRRIAQLLHVSQPAVMKSLKGIKDFIKSEQDKESKRWSIQLNIEDKHLLQLKRCFNLQQIYESGLSDFLENNLPGTTIILFGSYSRGEDTIKSDVDIAVIESKSKDLNLRMFEKKLERVININYYKNWKEIDEHLKNNILNGIVIAGGMEL